MPRKMFKCRKVYRDPATGEITHYGNHEWFLEPETYFYWNKISQGCLEILDKDAEIPDNRPVTQRRPRTAMQKADNLAGVKAKPALKMG